MNNTKTSQQAQVKSLAIIGGGWVGKPLTKQLTEQQYKVIATTQSEDNFSALQSVGAEPALLQLPLANVDEIPKQCQAIFAQQSLVIAIPPQIKKGRADYPEKIAQIVQLAELGAVERIILLSTTAVYNGCEGEVTESSELNQQGDKVEILAAAEKALSQFSKQSAVLRLAGLVGPGRHPGRFINSARVLANPMMPVNLIHLHDVLGLIQTLLEAKSINGIYHGVSDTHISKQAFYQASAEAIGLPAPVFSKALATGTHRIVLDTRTGSELAYQYQHANLLDWLASGVDNP